MTPEQMREMAAWLHEQADAMEGAPPALAGSKIAPAMQAAPRTEKLIDTAHAMKIANVSQSVSQSTLYNYARRYGIGTKSQGGQWRFYESKVRECFPRTTDRETCEFCEFCEVCEDGLPFRPNAAMFKTLKARR